MSQPLKPDNEAQRLAHLYELGLLDTERDQGFDRLTQLAQQIFQVPTALVSLVDRDRQWFKSVQGLDICETDRDISFCTHAIYQSKPLVVENTLEDERFRANPLVTGKEQLRFYAGVPLSIEQNLFLGTLCLLDTRPRSFSADDLERLQLLGHQVEELIRLHQERRRLVSEKRQVSVGRARYQAIVDSAAAGIVRINEQGLILEINPFALNFLGYQKEELLGQKVNKLMPQSWAVEHDSYLENYLVTGQQQIIGKGREVEALSKSGQLLPIHLAVSEIATEEAEERQFIGILSDLSEVRAAREAEKQEQRLLEVLHRGMTDYQALISQNRLWAFLMDALKDLTGSDYAFIGEVLEPDGQKALKLHAITDLSWSPESRELMQKLVEGDMLLSNPDTLIGRVFSRGQRILNNHMDSATRASYLPPGHPVLTRYLGIPIIDQGEVIGMYAIANAPQDYTEDLAEWLEPFTATCALLIRLYRQLQERESINQQLRSARDEAEQASKAKSDFLSSMSHELRTPMNAILGFAQLLQSGKHPLTDRQHRQAQQIYKSGQHLLTLINDVLDLAKIEAGRINVSLEPLAFSDVLADALVGLQPIADQYAVTLHQEGEGCSEWVVGDFTRCKQVLINLITNAIKYNTEQGQVKVRCRQQKTHLRIEIEDTGIGLSDEQQQQLFQPFNRLGAENSSIEGTGVGLALTRQLIEVMEGEIGVESQLGQGSCFWFTLPLTSAQVPHEADPSDTLQQPARFQLLYVEDNPANQRLLQAFCNEHSDYRLEIAPSAEVALELAASLQPDVILMDMDLPGLSGIQAKKMLARNPLTRELPVVAVTASDAYDKEWAAAGFVHWMKKPVDLSQLKALLDSILETDL